MCLLWLPLHGCDFHLLIDLDWNCDWVATDRPTNERTAAADASMRRLSAAAAMSSADTEALLLLRMMMMMVMLLLSMLIKKKAPLFGAVVDAVVQQPQQQQQCYRQSETPKCRAKRSTERTTWLIIAIMCTGTLQHSHTQKWSELNGRITGLLLLQLMRSENTTQRQRGTKRCCPPLVGDRQTDWRTLDLIHFFSNAVKTVCQ